MGDGSRRVTAITEVQGMESEIITIQEIFHFAFTSGGKESDRLAGRLQATGLRPKLVERIREAGIDLPGKVFVPGAVAPLGGHPQPRNLTPMAAATSQQIADPGAEIFAGRSRRRRSR